MSSAECTMGLRSFLLHEDAVHSSHRSSNHSRSPKAAELRTQTSEFGGPSLVGNGHTAAPSILVGGHNPCIDGSAAAQRRRHPPVVSKRNHFLLQQNNSMDPNYSGMDPSSNHHLLSNGGDVSALPHHHHHYQAPAANQKVNGFSPSTIYPTQGAEETLANGHGPNYHSSCSSFTKSQPSSSSFPTVYLGSPSGGHQAVEMKCRIRKGRSLAIQEDELQVNCVLPREEPSQGEVRRRRTKEEDQGEEDADNEVSETLLKSIAALPKIVVPTKFQVLNYVANAKRLQIRRTGSELQVTDATGFPLLDIWLKTSCFRRRASWVMESYGRTVLLMTDTEKSWWSRRPPPQPLVSQGTPAHIGGPSTSATNSNFDSFSKYTLQVLTPESETLGFFVVDDPFVLQNHERKCIARFMASGDEDSNISPPGSPLEQAHHAGNHCNSTMPVRHLYQCLLEGNGQEIGRLETHPSHCKLMQLRFGAATAMAFPLKLLVLASAVRLAAAISSMAANDERKQAHRDHPTIKLASSTHSLPQGGQDCCTIV